MSTISSNLTHSVGIVGLRVLAVILFEGILVGDGDTGRGIGVGRDGWVGPPRLRKSAMRHIRHISSNTPQIGPLHGFEMNRLKDIFQIR